MALVFAGVFFVASVKLAEHTAVSIGMIVACVLCITLYYSNNVKN